MCGTFAQSVMPAVVLADDMSRLGLISDTHNHLQNVAFAVAHFQAEGVRIVLHAGDVTGAEVLRLLSPFDLYLAWGNVDRPDDLTCVMGADGFGLTHVAHLHSLSFDGRTIALLHGDESLQLAQVIRSGAYDYVIHGHTHRTRDERFGRTRVINPGALGGGGLHPKAFAVLDYATDDLQILDV